MQHDEFIGQVQSRARLSSRGEAEQATRATLETLGERIPEGLLDNLAAELPPELGEHLRRTITQAGAGTGERFDRAEFIDRVTGRTGAEEPDAAYQARVVLEVLSEATTGQLIDKVRQSLPEDLRAFLTSGSTGNLGEQQSDRRTT